MAILKAHNSFLRANGKILVKSEGGLADFLYLSYFDGFDTETFIDTPIVGSPTTYVNSVDFSKPKYNAVKTTLNGMPALSIIASQSTPWYFHGQLLQNISENVISLEFFIKQLGTTSYSSEAGLLGLDHWTNPYNSFCVLLACEYSKNTITFFTRNFGFSTYNGAYYDYQGQRRGYRLPYQIYNKTIHCAITLNKELNKGRLYVDGNLYIEFTGINSTDIFQSLAFEMINNSTSETLTITQLAVRKGDFSINDGMNFPIPQTPYYPSILNN